MSDLFHAISTVNQAVVDRLRPFQQNQKSRYAKLGLNRVPAGKAAAPFSILADSVDDFDPPPQYGEQRSNLLRPFSPEFDHLELVAASEATQSLEDLKEDFPEALFEERDEENADIADFQKQLATAKSDVSGWTVISQTNQAPTFYRRAKPAEAVADFLDSTGWVDEKYFDHDGYLEYTQKMEKTEKKHAGGVKATTVGTSGKPAKKAVKSKEESRVQATAALTSVTTASEVPTMATGTATFITKASKMPGTVAEPQISSLARPHDEPHSPRGRVQVTHNPEDPQIQSPNHDKISGSHSIFDATTTPRISSAPNTPCTLFHPLEEAWLLLFHKKLLLAAKSPLPVRLPLHLPIVLSFNTFFAGRIFQNEHGVDLAPRPARTHTSIRCKINYKGVELWNVRDAMRKAADAKKKGRKDVIYVPIITMEELLRYVESGTVEVDDPMDKEKNATMKEGGERFKREGITKRKAEEEAKERKRATKK